MGSLGCIIPHHHLLTRLAFLRQPRPRLPLPPLLLPLPRHSSSSSSQAPAEPPSRSANAAAVVQALASFLSGFTSRSTPSAANPARSAGPSSASSASSAGSAGSVPPISATDRFYRLLIRNDFFSNGLGSPRTLANLCAVLGKANDLVPASHPIHLHRTERQADHVVVEGSLVSPLALLCPEMIPDESVWARFQLVLPKDYPAHLLTSAPLEESHRLLRQLVTTRKEHMAQLEKQDLAAAAGVPLDSVLNAVPVSWRWRESLGLPKHPTMVPPTVPSAVLDSILGQFLLYVSQTNSSLSPRSMEPFFLNGLNDQEVQKASQAQARPKIPASIIFPATGDHSFWRRKALQAVPLAKKGIATVLLENPLYGQRKPKAQFRSNLRHVFDLYVMGAQNQFETVAILNWLERNDFGPLGLAGMSLGGYMASISATVWPKELALVNFLGPATASGVFTRGVLSLSCNWKAIREEIRNLHPSEVIKNEKEYVRQLMDDLTGIYHYPRPKSQKGFIIIGAKEDAYIPFEDVELFKSFWPDAEMRYLSTGHVGSFLFHNKDFLRAIEDAFSRLRLT